MKYIIDFLDQCTTEEIDNYLSENSLVKLTTFDSFGKVFLVEGSTVPPHTELIEEVTEDKDLSIQLEEYSTITVPINEENWWKVVSYTDSPIDKNTTELKINLMDTSVDVYVIDSGINDAHPEFEGQTINDLYSVEPDDFSDRNGHGTAIASVITGNTCAITRANIHNVKVYPKSGVVTLGNILESLDAVKKHSDSKPEKLAVANMSWVIEKNSYVDKKIQNLIGSGVAVVCAAGNDNTELSKFTPASVPEAFTIGSFNEDFEPCDFTNYGSIDLWAPGVNIRVADSKSSYTQTYGTSISTAIATANICYNAHELSEIYSKTFGVNINKNTATVDDYLTMSQIRQGLLDLTPPHENSVNKIATFSRFGGSKFRDIWSKNKYRKNFKPFKTYKTEFFKFLYLLEDFEKVETLNLPNGLNVKNGWIVGNLDPLLEGVPYKEHFFKITITHENKKETSFECVITQMSEDEELLSDLSTYDAKFKFMSTGAACESSCVDDCVFFKSCEELTAKKCFCED